MSKGVSPFISYALVILLAVSAVAIITVMGLPVIRQSQESISFNLALNNLQQLDSMIREVASEGQGSLRSVQISVTGGRYFMDVNKLIFSFEPSKSFIPNGTNLTRGGIRIEAGQVTLFTGSNTTLPMPLHLNHTNASVYLHGGNGATGYANYSINMTNDTLSNSTITGYSFSGGNVNYNVLLDSDNSTSVNNLLNISGLNNVGVYYNASDGTWRNVSELGSIGQGYWNLTGTWLNYTLGGGDGYDNGIRDALAGGSYWLDENGRSLETGLVGYWQFGEGSGSNTSDSSGNNNTGNVIGATWNTSCKFGNCLSFDGNDYASATGSFGSLNKLTLTAWVKFNQVNSNNYLIHENGDKYVMSVFNSKLRGLANTGSDIVTDGATTISANQWYHLAVVYTGANVKVYVNGIDDQSSPTAGTGTVSGGNIVVLGGKATVFFNGLMDEARVYSRALSAEEIKRLYESTAIDIKSDFVSARVEPYIQLNLTNSTSQTIFQQTAENILLDNTPITTKYPVNASTTYFFDWKENDWKVWQKNNYNDALVGNWKLDDGQGQTVADFSGRGNNGVLGNTSTSEPRTDPVWVSNSSCKFGSCLHFNGSQFVNTTDGIVEGTSMLTVQVWVYVEKSSRDVFVGKYYSGTGFLLYLTSDSKLRFLVNANSQSTADYAVGITNNTWYHVVGTYDGTTTKLYLDGKEVGSASNSGNVVTSNDAVLIGLGNTEADPYYHQGYIDDVKIWSRALTAEEIKAEYQNTKRGMPDWTDPRFKQEFKWMQSFSGGNNPGINITYMMTAADPFIRTFVDTGPTGYASTVDQNTVGYWQFNEGSGASTADSSIYGNTGTLINGGTGSYQNASWSSNCKIGNCLVFNGTNGYVSAANYINATSITFSAWFKLSNFSTQNQWIIGTDDNTVRQCNFYVEGNSNKISFYCYNSNMDASTIQQSSAINTNQWYHAAGVYDTQKLVLYVNGVNVMSTTYGSGLALHSGVVPNIGRSPYGNAYFNGTIDEVRIWNRSLTADEVVEEYQRGVQHNLTIPVNLGQEKGILTWMDSTSWREPESFSTDAVASSQRWSVFNTSGVYVFNDTGICNTWCPNGAGMIKTGIFFFELNSNDNPLFTTQNFRYGQNRHNGATLVINDTDNNGKWDKIGYLNNFNSTNNNNFIFTLGYAGTQGTTGFNPTTNQLGFSNETLEQVANSTLTYYDLRDNKLVGWWKFNDGSTTAVDSSIFSNTGTLNTNVTWLTNSSCKTGYGYCLSFNGSLAGNSVSISDAASLDLAKAFTITTWVNLAKLPGGTGAVAGIVGKNDAYQFGIDTSPANKLALNLNDGSNTYLNGNTALSSTNTWYHVAVTWDGSTVIFYLNGASDGTNTYTSTLANSANALNIGLVSSWGTNSFFNGTLDNIKIYRRALSADEIKVDYLATSDSYPNWAKTDDASTGNINITHIVPNVWNYDGGAAGIWKFDEGSGSVAADGSGNGNSGTLVNLPNITWVGGSSCKYWSCLNFTGSNGYVWLGQDKFTTAQTSKGTIEMWFNPATLSPSFQYLVDFEGAIAIRLEPNQIRGYNDGSGGGVTYSVTQPNTWYHLVMVWDNSTNKLYVNGKQVFSVSANTYSLDSLTRNQTIGGQYVYNNYFNGTMDEIRIYSRALSDYEVWEHYSQGVSKYYDDFNVGAKRNYGVEDSSTNLQPITPKDAVLHLRFNDNPTINVTDSSGYGNNGNVVNVSWFNNASCRNNFGGCMYFDGSGDYVKVPDVTSLQNNNTFTIAAWINPSATTSRNVIIRRGTSGEINYRLYLDTNGVPTFEVYDGTNDFFVYDASLRSVVANQWYYLAATWDRSGDGKLYINGSLIASSTSTITKDVVGTIGTVAVGIYSDLSSTPFNGMIDEVLIINRSLSADEIYQMYLGGYSRHTGDLVGWWKFNDNAGTNALDSSGNGNTGTINGVSQAWNSGWNTTDCRIGGCLKFDGSDDYVIIGKPASLDTLQEITFEAWVKYRGYTYYPAIFDKNNRYLRVLSSGVLDSLIGYSATNAGSISIDTIPTDTWTFVTLTYSESGDRKIHLYLNGTEVSYSTQTDSVGTALGDAIHNLAIGSQSAGAQQYFNGTIDNVKIFKRALTADEVLSEYQQSHDQYSIYNYQHRVASADGIPTIAYNLTDHDFASQQGYDQRMLLINGTQQTWFNATQVLTGSTKALNMTLQYDKITLTGTMSIQSGNYKICVQNNGVSGGKTVVNIGLC